MFVKFFSNTKNLSVVSKAKNGKLPKRIAKFNDDGEFITDDKAKIEKLRTRFRYEELKENPYLPKEYKPQVIAKEKPKPKKSKVRFKVLKRLKKKKE